MNSDKTSFTLTFIEINDDSSADITQSKKSCNKNCSQCKKQATKKIALHNSDNS